MSWYEALMFCAWDGGWLPTEAEWEYAAAGGSENRLYPWGSSAPTNGLLVWNCEYGGIPGDCTVEDIAKVGSLSGGAGRWGHKDLAGSMLEWVLDAYDENWYSGGGINCNNCANFADDLRVFRGGGWLIYAPTIFRAAERDGAVPAARDSDHGFRCARPLIRDPQTLDRV